MLILLILMLISSSLARIPYVCNEIRFETEQEAERRQLFERCTEICSVFGTGEIPCNECRIPYKDYGCLRKKQEAELDCVLGCDLLLPDRTAQMRCRERCDTTKSLYYL